MAAISVMMCLLSISATFASSDSPFIVANKKVSLNSLKSGIERVSVSIDIYNQGSATAYDVSLTDGEWSPSIFNLVSGNTSKSWEKLDVGSVVSHTFVLESNVKGVYHASPAVIKFRTPTKASLQEAFSSPILPLEILADRPPEKKFEWRLLAKYGSLVSVLTIVVSFIYLVASPSKSSGGKAGKKRR
ncbi:hypothetical protein MKX03_037658 [Papaver bracteatum]|nr:hypothetical protein MKX03_037658 [Papaver bracteatum]